MVRRFGSRNPCTRARNDMAVIGVHLHRRHRRGTVNLRVDTSDDTRSRKDRVNNCCGFVSIFIVNRNAKFTTFAQPVGKGLTDFLHEGRCAQTAILLGEGRPRAAVNVRGARRSTAPVQLVRATTATALPLYVESVSFQSTYRTPFSVVRRARTSCSLDSGMIWTPSSAPCSSSAI